MTAGKIMTREVTTINMDTSAKDAMIIFLRGEMDALPVLNREKDLVGIITETDFIYVDRKLNPTSHYAYDEAYITISDKTFLENLNKLKELQAKDIMTEKIISIEEDTSIKRIVDIIINKKIKFLPVVKNNKILGIVTRKNILCYYLNMQ